MENHVGRTLVFLTPYIEWWHNSHREIVEKKHQLSAYFLSLISLKSNPTKTCSVLCVRGFQLQSTVVNVLQILQHWIGTYLSYKTTLNSLLPCEYPLNQGLIKYFLYVLKEKLFWIYFYCIFLWTDNNLVLCLTHM